MRPPRVPIDTTCARSRDWAIMLTALGSSSNPSTLAALSHAGVTTYRTDDDGTVTLTIDHGAMHVTTER